MPKADVTKFQVTIVDPGTMKVQNRVVLRTEELAKEIADIIERGNERAGIYELVTVVPIVVEEWT